MQHVFIIGSKGIPAQYGGFETFVEKLTHYRMDSKIQYHVACMGKTQKEYMYNEARCFEVKVPNIGPAKAVYYDLAAINQTLNYIRKHQLRNAIIYILACRIGPFMWYLKKRCKNLHCKIYVNPDGHEWMRAKWNTAIKKYWKYSEKLMVKYADLLICDSVNIEKYINNQYSQYTPNTIFIPYGAETRGPMDKTDIEIKNKCKNWYQKFNLSEGNYYLIVGRFVPENNYATAIKEFLVSDTKKKLVLITNYEDNRYYNQLKDDTRFDLDNRIQFVGTVYDSELLYEIRKNAFAYIHGHEVGGTNPSLLEALATTNINLLLDVSFNREVGADTAFYWKKETGDLANLISKIEKMEIRETEKKGILAKERIQREYSWEKIVREYESVLKA